MQPVSVDEFRIAPGETYDVLVEPKDSGPYAVFAETIDRSGYAMGMLSVGDGAKATIPDRRKRPVRSMDDMGMAMGAMQMPGMEKPGMKMPPTAANGKPSAAMPGMKMNAEMKMESPKKDEHSGQTKSEIPGLTPVKHGSDTHGVGNAMAPEQTKNRLHEPGTGFENSNRKVLVYTDLKSVKAFEDQRTPSREIELHLTGNMERYMWSIDGKKYSDASEAIPFHFGERLRLTFVNDTMMEHPMHLHGMWMYLENGHGAYLPRKHTIIVKPAERLSVAVTADAIGDWAFHCHMLIHMELGMFRVVRVSKEMREAKA